MDLFLLQIFAIQNVLLTFIEVEEGHKEVEDFSLKNVLPVKDIAEIY